MAVRALIGLQWGDEGKGKVIDARSAKVDVVVRCQGGANAGHTVVVGGQKRVLRLVPSGILFPQVTGLIGNGVVVDPVQLVQEIDALDASGFALGGRLFASSRAHVVLPYHRELDLLSEDERGGAKLGTTGRGIGPAYADKAARLGVVLGDFVNERRFTPRFDVAFALKNKTLAAGGRPTLVRDALLAELLPAARRLKPLVADVFEKLQSAVAERREIWLEGAQGALLDVDHGTYPFVTSSNTHIGGLLSGAGLAPRHLDGVTGVAKAYTTRVGEGPFPTEDHGPTGAAIRERGGEFGAVTGRPRRCGWLDLVALRYAVRLNGADEITLTKADVLSGLEDVKVCVAYRVAGVESREFPSADALGDIEPAYRTFKGWREDIADVRRFEDLPPALQAYIRFVESYLETPITWVSTGPERGQIFRRGGA
jgi:adenylosuccinate synthase